MTIKKLVGTDKNQVPLNRDLGTLAYQDSSAVQAYSPQLQGAVQGGINGFKNRIINGAMMIDQRNAGASVTPVDGGYTIDRWQYFLSQSSKVSAQRSTTAPAGFINSLVSTSLSSYSVGASDIFSVVQQIEGLNMADLGWGTADAQPVTVSFRVRSSLTGTFGGWIRNSGGTRGYVFSYTISSANTWETKSVTIAGDTTGTWLTTNGSGLMLGFSLGAGSSVSTTAGSWAGAASYGVTGGQSVVGTSGATFYITGVQLEKGSTATSFDYRPYGTELQLAQRYYQTTGVVSLSAYADNGVIGFMFQTPMRGTPSVTFSYNGTTNRMYNIATGANSDLSSPVVIVNANALAQIYAFSPSSWAVGKGTGFNSSFTFSAEL